MKPIVPTLAACFALNLGAHAQTQTQPTSEATLYSTMPSTILHRPEMALDGDRNSFFQSVYSMDEGDDFTVMFSRPVPLRSLRIETGDADGEDLLTKGYVEISTDGVKYTRAATFDAKGVASAILGGAPIAAMRIKVNARTGLPSLVVREIALDSALPIGHISYGAGRAFSDYSGFPDLKAWADKPTAR